LHRYLSQSDAIDSVFLAKGGPPLSTAGRPHLGTCIAPVDQHANEYFCYTEDWNATYDWTFGSIRPDKQLYTRHIRAFLEAVQPDIVHLHHTMFFGYDILREIRNTLPNAPIVYTLHEFMPICHRQGQLLRVIDDEPCMEESPRRCHECFPHISPQTFFMRKRFVRSQFSVVDRFIAPSQFLADRYIDWGLPAEKVIVEEYGRTPPHGTSDLRPRPFRDRFGYFGQLTPFKGVQVLLEAMGILADQGGAATDPLIAALERAVQGPVASSAVTPQERPRPRARVHGANLDLQPGAFQNRIKELLEAAGPSVSFVGKYDHANLSSHMDNVDWVVVPSVWWENSPLVIQEAFHFGRPVICSDIGGMAEKVEAGVNGLHFRAGDPTSLASVIEDAADDPALWERLRANIKPVYTMDEHVKKLTVLYEDLLNEEAIAHAG
jgi:glycosyltransferase involved in cell wall biosynthesis